MLAFAATLLPGAGVASLAVLTYAVAITATMSLLGAGVGATFGRLGERSATVHGVAQTVAGVVVVGLAVLLVADAGVVPA